MEKNIQDALSRVSGEGNTEETDPTKTNETDPKENGEEEENGQGEDPKPSGEAGKAFAAMRVKIKQLEEQLAAATKPPEEPQETKPPEETKGETKDPDKTEDSELAKTVKALQEQLKTIQSEREQNQQERQQAETVAQLKKLQADYGLDDKGLIKFADDAEEAGYKLSEAGRSFDELYRLVYFDDLVNKEVERVKAELSGAQAPGTGPRGQSTGSKATKTNVRSAIARIAEKA